MEEEDKGKESSRESGAGSGSPGENKIIDLRLVEKYVGCSKFCREDMKHISPGWGYGGPINLAQEEVESSDKDFKAYRTVASEDYIEIKDIFQEDNWDHAANSAIDSVRKAVKYADISVSQCFAWIPSDVGALLTESVDILEELSFKVIKADMAEAPDKDYFKLMLFIGDGTEFYGDGATPLEAAFSLYINCWEFHYDMMRPSLVDVTGDFLSNFSWNDEPTLRFNNYMEALQFVDEPIVRYFIDGIKKNRRSIMENSYVGLFSFIEGDYHIILNTARKSEKWSDPI